MSKAEKANVKVLFSKLMNYSRGGSKVSDEILFWIQTYSMENFTRNVLKI